MKSAGAGCTFFLIWRGVLINDRLTAGTNIVQVMALNSIPETSALNASFVIGREFRTTQSKAAAAYGYGFDMDD